MIFLYFFFLIARTEYGVTSLPKPAVVGTVIYAANIDLNTESLEPLFRHKILAMLKKRGLIT